MSIRFSKYIDITSAVGGAAQVPSRLWVGRIFTTNPLVGPNSVLQFTASDASDVLAFFGAGEEYNRAVKYMSYVSPLGTRPAAIQFARYVEALQPATIFGEASVAVLATLKAITAGVLSFKFGATQVNLTGISFSAATALTDVATELQTAIRAASGAPNGELTTATVTWNSTSQAFDFSASATGVVTEKFQVVTPTGAVTATDVAAALGWYASQGALVNDAMVAETAVASFSRVNNLNNNCGEIVYTDTAALQLADYVAIATANQALNVTYIVRVPVTPSDWSAYQAALVGIAGSGLELEDITVTTGGREYIEMLPMSIHASINFNAQNGTLGFMYKQNGVYSASITDNAGTLQSDTLDAARVNYYGQTQQAGQNISFYQRGVLCGGSTAPVDSTVYANEQWFKDMCASNLMNLQLSQGQIPANKRGQTLIVGTLEGNTATANTSATGIQLAIFNGTISVNGTFTLAQQAYITSQTGDATAWQQVQNNGYWLNVTISSAVVASGATEYTANYTIIYRKDDVIKTIVGSHQLI